MTINDNEAVARSIAMLNGKRFNQNANKVYQMPTKLFESVKYDPIQIQKYVVPFLKKHCYEQVPRIVELERYYQGDNNIHYWDSKKAQNRADNRIASGFPKFITNIRTGYFLGNHIKFQFSNDNNQKTDIDKLDRTISDYNKRVDEGYHEKVMKKNLSVTGRAYELIYVEEDETQANMKPIDPANAFVVYDTTVEHHSLFAVRYYKVEFLNQTYFNVEVYTDENIYYYKTKDNELSHLKFLDEDEHFFGAVPITEFVNNDEMMGDWEAKLDDIDAYDKGKSEMANFQEDFSNAIMVLVGMFAGQKNDDDEDGENRPLNVDPLKRFMWLKPYVNQNQDGSVSAIQPNAFYLTKEFDSVGWKTYIDQLVSDIHKDTNTPNTTDENFSANASGVAMSYKLWGNDQERKVQEDLFTRGLMRRYRLLGNYWEKLNQIRNVDLVESLTSIYTPNLPKNDKETMDIANEAVNNVSKETYFGMIESITGVSSETEMSRVSDEEENQRVNIESDNEDYRDTFNQDEEVDEDDQPTTKDLVKSMRKLESRDK